MVATDKVFAGSIPEIYDRFLVPLIFEPYALDLAGRIASAAAARCAGDRRRHRRADPRPGGAACQQTRASSPPISTSRCSIRRQRDTGRREPHHLAAGGCAEAAVRGSIVRCRWPASSARCSFPTRSRATGGAPRPEARRAFLFNVWDEIADNEFADVVTEVLAAMFPQDPPRFMARTPHGYHDTDQIREQLDRGGIFRRFRSRRSTTEPARLAARIRRSPIVRARRSETRSRPATRRGWRRRRTRQPRRSRSGLATAPSTAASAPSSSARRADASQLQ